MDENLEHNSEFEDDEPSREELALWLSEYMSNAVSAETPSSAGYAP